ncbi:type ISP restriction/modification enzyme [Candidatus Parabeggiatoa sp. HSG14]|uniref:type ISP restriction/modification enzyme n=1 Tax=Candidatus Parabeggiatoa sp. HSG14 TaxID=3055593 RepID=UPI0025A7000E|nr:N-6 DNA methylase [Thiotrichales bacterium HSG14]
MDNPIHQYLNQIQANLGTGIAKEHSHRAALQNLLISKCSTINVINEPKRIECGSPDLVILDSQANNVPLGYIEAKDIGQSLDKALKTEQLERYLDFSDNLILTDYLEFRWFVKHERQPKIIVRLANRDKYGNLQALPDAFGDFENLIELFIQTQAITLRNPEELAERMAKIAIPMRDAVFTAYEKSSSLHEQFESFRSILVDSLTVEQFADMYAQTACYGLFATKCNASLTEPFSRIHANHYVPKTNPFLRHLFNQIVGIDIDDRLVWTVEHLVTVLNHADIAAILADFGKRTRQEDPVVHFYETFLKHYDPNMREMRGVYYTPEPVVSYIVRSVDLLLKQQFKLRNGLADSSRLESGLHKVQILDPAVGTGTFLYTVFNQIFAKFIKNKGMWSTYVSQHLLPRVHGFELLMAPYTVAHMKLGLQLQEMGYEFDSDERLQIFLTNSLEDAFEKGSTPTLPFAEWLVNEEQAASGVKQDSTVMVVVGNPPYSGHSVNVGEWIVNLLKGVDERNHQGKTANYFQVDGKPLKERNSKWLNDDYVKFIRFAQWRINTTGYGILGFVTNHGYLDNPTFRGMRQALMQDFDEIYILDLHGNSKKKEKCPDGSVDKNVFDIQQGVAIGIFVKHKSKQTAIAKVFHAELWGERDGKYAWLEAQDVKTTDWEVLKPTSPFYLFIPQNTELLDEYEQYWKVTDIMPVNSVGIVTARDNLTIHESPQAVMETVKDFVSLESETAREKYQLGKDARDWQVNLAQTDIESHDIDDSYVTPILYRPFDRRYTYYTGKTKGFLCMPRSNVMQHILAGENLGLITRRQMLPSQPCTYFYVSNNIISDGVIRSDNRGGESLFPLYLYPTEQDEFLNGNGNGNGKPKPKRKPNFTPNFIKDVETRLKLKFIDDGTGNLKTTIGPEDVFHYMYAVSHSPTYRQRYAEFLKIDFPRLPLTSDKKLFKQLAKLGKQLVTIHLMEADIDSDSSYPVEGDNLVDKITYKDEKVYINKTQYFDNVVDTVWQFHIGGYQVCQKWLKDRKGRELSYEDCEHYFYILAALEQTIDLMEKIDATLPEFPLF